MKHFEFWHPRLFELPYYLYLLGGCALRLLPIKSLAKANYALDHGEIGIGSKVQTQFAFDQTHFLPTEALPDTLNPGAKEALVLQFGEKHGYPLILKSDIGSVGKGVVKLLASNEIAARQRPAWSVSGTKIHSPQQRVWCFLCSPQRQRRDHRH